ncbi:glutaminase A [Mangrovivirga sp. M17]|uniref:Glutaminase n=1 Tax=Mangrovivirga halotolerans TaxID=2993936 RepID=A0ABT3RRS8_9BACT|nr:glutaminase A [Mangrovivirga halotolerans]MCX2744186.1 glutaminase A [Mangrovivirga halotolerans]
MDNIQFKISLYRHIIVLLLCTFCIIPSLAQKATFSADEYNEALQEAHEKLLQNKDGANADYIPVLAEVPSDLFGISICTVDGEIYDIGDSEHRFSIQSISKVFTLAMVMQRLGINAIPDTIGVNATGRPFNSIVAIETQPDRPSNSCVNAGAIATTSLVEGNTYDEKWNNIISTFSKFAGRDLDVDQEVYESEAATNNRNRAIAHLLEAYGRMYYDPVEATDIYTKQCAISVNSHDLAVMSATLANGGVNPQTNEKIIDEKYLPHIMAVMCTAGLYDDSGLWLYYVGLPGKSGVGGGVIAVAPGRFGIAAFSPRLDVAGNSVRGVRAIIEVSRKLGVNLFTVK